MREVRVSPLPHREVGENKLFSISIVSCFALALQPTYLVALSRFELEAPDYESGVLPLHHSAMCCLY